jgi:1-pyrroline-5-carboxylate dehydrogenase
MESATVPGSRTGDEQAPPQAPPGEGFRQAAAGAGTQARARPPAPENEPVLDYAPGSPERDAIKAELARQAGQEIEIPLIIGGEEVRTGDTVEVVMPHDHDHVLGRCHRAGAEEARAAVEASREAWSEWSAWSWEDRAAVFLRAAELLAGSWRARVNAATMLGQSKTVHQAEIDSACELIDFWRFNVRYAADIYGQQPDSSPGVWNRLDYRPLEGFVYAVTPFNFTSIGGNLPTAPALMGNVAIWKPAGTAVLSNYYVMRVLQEAGLPDGVINFLPGHAREISGELMPSPELAGVHFTGSTSTFQLLWRQVSENLERYRSYPRVVGETGGKDFIVAHESADVDALAVAVVRGGFEYQGQKCSAVSRVYVPEGLWPELRERVLGMVDDMEMGDPRDFRNFVGAVIDRDAYDKITGYLDHARRADGLEILAGGGASDEEGWFVEPTVVRSDEPRSRLMCEEIFGPVVTVHVYPDGEFERALELTDATSPYALTGSIFADDRAAVRKATLRLRHAAGNFYVNDKPTGAVVGQQPFGGSRASGTNDKAGSRLNLLRWVTPRAIKETLEPATDYRYPFMEKK